MLITDPPYNVDIGEVNLEAAKIRHRRLDLKFIENDNMSDAAFRDFLYEAFTNAIEVVKVGGAAYVWMASTEIDACIESFERAGWLYKQLLVWVKNSIVWGNTGAETQLSVDENKVSYSCYPGAAAGNGNISENPLLLTTGQRRGYLESGSPCKNAGNASGWTASDIDLAGRPRLRKGKIDMGCYQAALRGLLLMVR